MNKVILMGRLTKDVDVRISNNEKQTKVARYTLAVDRISDKENADFFNCVGFDKTADFAEKYLSKGMKILVEGHLQTGSYTNKDGQKVFTTDVMVEKHYFVESKKEEPIKTLDVSSFVAVPDGVEDEGLPFN